MRNRSAHAYPRGNGLVAPDSAFRTPHSALDIGLIDRGDLDDRAGVVEDGAEAVGEVVVVGEVAAQEDGVGAEAAGVGERHGRADAAGTRGISSGCDDSPAV